MTDPRSFLIRMISVLGIFILICGFLYEQIYISFMGNPILNGTIIATALIGVIYIFRQVLLLVPEVKWLSDVQRTRTLSKKNAKPVLLATVNVMLADQTNERQLSAQSLRSVLDGVAARLDEGREISRYMIGLLIFLGLLGTFWGLLQTIGAVGNVVDGLSSTNANLDRMMEQLRSGLDAPLSGMATAFSSSLFGLTGSLVLGFLDLQLGQAMGRFFNEVEDWLSSFARYNDVRGQETQPQASSGLMSEGLNEEGARALLQLARAIERSEKSRESTESQLDKLNIHLGLLSEQITDDKRIRDQLILLNSRLESLGSQIMNASREQQDALGTDLRSLATSIDRLISNNLKSEK